jgi:hypothetical protein
VLLLWPLLLLQDMHKLMNKDKIILRFTARMTPGQSAVSHADAGGTPLSVCRGVLPPHG